MAKPKLFAQASAPKVEDILKLKENFPNLLTKKIKNIHNLINSSRKIKSRINMTIKDLSRRQIIVPMSNDNKSKFITIFSLHITNLNRVLKNIKSEVMANFVCIN